MWFLFFFIVIPFILFIGFLVFSIFAIFLINRIFHKKYSQSFSLILPCFSLIFYFILITGGISFKSIDPQYYEFKELCKGAGEIINYSSKYESLKKEYGWNTIYNKPIKVTNRIEEHSYYNQLNNVIIFYEYNFYIYKYFGIFLKGDEGRGWHWETESTVGCKP